MVLAGCEDLPRNLGNKVPQGVLGVITDRTPPEPELARGGANGALIEGSAPGIVPPKLADEAVGTELRQWLTADERLALADASQRAAVAVTGVPVAWHGKNPGGHGVAMATNDVYRSLRGYICRDLRQSVDKGGEPHAEQVTLCRVDQGNGLFGWVVGSAE